MGLRKLIWTRGKSYRPDKSLVVCVCVCDMRMGCGELRSFDWIKGSL